LEIPSLPVRQLFRKTQIEIYHQSEDDSMNVGYQIKKTFTRPPRELIERFSGIPVPNIDDAMNRTAAVSAKIRPVNHARLTGPAYTVRVPAGDNLLFYYALDNAEPGDVIVVDGGGFLGRALCGDIMASFARKRGLAGFVINGVVRDIVELSTSDFPVFTKGCCPNGPYKNGPGEINVPVNIDGRVICPGDILIGDGGGLVSLRAEDAEGVLEKARLVMEKEAHMMEEIEQSGHMDLQWMYSKIAEGGVCFLD